MGKVLISVLLLIFSGCSAAFAREAVFYQPVEKNDSLVTQEQYNSIRRYFLLNYSARSNLSGLPVIFPDEWESPYFAGFVKRFPDYYSIHVWGGTVRAKGMTHANLVAIYCHELGHLLGEGPLQTIPGADWIVAEGAADHFAASECVPKAVRENPQWFVGLEAQDFDECGENLICHKISQVGLSLIRFLQFYSYQKYTPVELGLKSRATGKTLINSYPADQCRLDIFKQGALCVKDKSQCYFSDCWFNLE